MKRLLKVAALSMFCLGLSSCADDKSVALLPTPAERLVCDAAGERPTVPAEHAIDWATVVTVSQAQTEHTKYITSVRDREGIIAGYIMRVEGKLFTCYSNMQWRRAYEAQLSE